MTEKRLPKKRSEQILDDLRKMTNKRNVEGMARFGIRPGTEVFGVPIPVLRKKAKEIGKDHELAIELWRSGVHEGRLLACFVDDPRKVTEQQVDTWVGEFDSWDICDQCISNLVDKTDFAERKVFEWAVRDEEFVKRAAFTLIAALAVHDKKAPDDQFIQYMPLIIDASTDERNFVKKAVNWALRQVGKRNRKLNAVAVKTAEEILRSQSRSGRWIASDALRELKSESVARKVAAVRKSTKD